MGRADNEYRYIDDTLLDKLIERKKQNRDDLDLV